MKVYANIDSLESMSYLKSRFGSTINRIQLSTETQGMLKEQEYQEIAEWIKNYTTDVASLGYGIICGVVE